MAIADAVCRMIDRSGLESVTFRRIAAETGYSVGVLNHFFDDKDALFAFTLQVVSDRSLASLTPSGEEFPEDVAGIVDVLLAAVPATPAGLRDSRVWVSLWARSVDRPAFAAAMIDRDAEWRRSFAALLAEAVRRGVLAPGADADRVVDRLQVAIDGLNFRAVLDPAAWPAERLRAELAGFLDALSRQASHPG